MKEVRVRFAPSPTGYLHIGGARTCLFNWLFARKNGGKLILRIEDTDLERIKEDSINQILESLAWIGLNWDEGPGKGGDFGPYFQAQRLEVYKKEVDRLLAEDKAYYCFCTQEETEEKRQKAQKEGVFYRYDRNCSKLTKEEVHELLNQGKKAVVRVRVPESGQTIVTDMIRGQVVFENALLDDMVIMKSNGMPTYNFACTVDDNAMEISHVIRAEEHLSNTPKQMIMYKALGYDIPEFAHVPMILAPDRSKLSKRHGATSVEEFREQGILAEALVNYLCLLGWSAEGQEEIISLEEAMKQFSLERVSKNPAVYDTKKLTWINGNYLKTLDLNYITDLAIPFMKNAGIKIEKVNTEKLKAVVGLVREKVWTLAEIADASSYFFTDEFEYDAKGVEKYFSGEFICKYFQELITRLQNIEDFDKEITERVYRDYAEELGIKAGELIHPTRLALTGRTVSPGLFEIMEIMGKDECIKRMDKINKRLKIGS
ncbi:MAG: glutamate--tRNA ligase [Ignavibacteriales bacterium]